MKDRRAEKARLANELDRPFGLGSRHALEHHAQHCRVDSLGDRCGNRAVAGGRKGHQKALALARAAPHFVEETRELFERYLRRVRDLNWVTEMNHAGSG